METTLKLTANSVVVNSTAITRTFANEIVPSSAKMTYAAARNIFYPVGNEISFDVVCTLITGLSHLLQAPVTAATS